MKENLENPTEKKKRNWKKDLGIIILIVIIIWLILYKWACSTNEKKSSKNFWDFSRVSESSEDTAKKIKKINQGRDYDVNRKDSNKIKDTVVVAVSEKKENSNLKVTVSSSKNKTNNSEPKTVVVESPKTEEQVLVTPAVEEPVLVLEEEEEIEEPIVLELPEVQQEEKEEELVVLKSVDVIKFPQGPSIKFLTMQYENQPQKIEPYVDEQDKFILVPFATVKDFKPYMKEMELLPGYIHEQNPEEGKISVVKKADKKRIDYTILPIIESIELNNVQIPREIHAGDLDKELEFKLIMNNESKVRVPALSFNLYVKNLEHRNGQIHKIQLTEVKKEDNVYYYQLKNQNFTWKDLIDRTFELEVEFTNAFKGLKIEYAEIKKLQYQITSVQDFKNIKFDLKGNYIQTKDFIANNNEDAIGSLALPFQGSYDGQNKQILIKRWSNQKQTPGRVDFGLFGYVEQAQFRDIQLNIENIELLKFNIEEVNFGFIVGYGIGLDLDNIRVNILKDLKINAQEINFGMVVGKLGKDKKDDNNKVNSFKNLNVSLKKLELETEDLAHVGGILGRSDYSLDLENIQVIADKLFVSSELSQAIVAGLVGSLISENLKGIQLNINKNIEIQVKDNIQAYVDLENTSDLDFSVAAGLIGYAYYTNIHLNPGIKLKVEAKTIQANGQRCYVGGYLGNHTHMLQMIFSKETEPFLIKADLIIGGSTGSKVRESYAGGIAGKTGSFGYESDEDGTEKSVFFGTQIQNVRFKLLGGIKITHNEASEDISFAGGFFGEAAVSRMTGLSVEIQNGITSIKRNNIGVVAGYIGKLLNAKENNFYFETASIMKPNFLLQGATTSPYVGNLKIRN